jgi:hypothetical protein
MRVWSLAEEEEMVGYLDRPRGDPRFSERLEQMSLPAVP